MSPVFSFLSFLSLPLLVVVVGAGCGSSSSAAGNSCNLDPFQCASGSTCTVKDCNCATPTTCTNETCTPEFACLPSASSNLVGASCTTEFNTATCGDGLACIVEMGSGTCTQYCDSSQPCPMGLACEGVTVKLGPSGSYPVIHVCQVPGADGGIMAIDSGSGGPPPPADAALDTPTFDVVFVDHSAK